MIYTIQHFEAYDDERGRLLPLELTDVPFPVRRVFTVHGPEHGAVRGEHRTTCDELIVLTSGEARLEIEHEHVLELAKPGDAVHVRPGDFVRYSLPDRHSSILVLASEPYDGSRPA